MPALRYMPPSREPASSDVRHGPLLTAPPIATPRITVSHVAPSPNSVPMPSTRSALGNLDMLPPPRGASYHPGLSPGTLVHKALSAPDFVPGVGKAVDNIGVAAEFGHLLGD